MAKKQSVVIKSSVSKKGVLIKKTAQKEAARLPIPSQRAYRRAQIVAIDQHQQRRRQAALAEIAAIEADLTREATLFAPSVRETLHATRTRPWSSPMATYTHLPKIRPVILGAGSVLVFVAFIISLWLSGLLI